MRLADVHTTQLNDPTSSIDGLNCSCAGGATAVKWHYRNQRPTPDPALIWPPTAGVVRALCREPDGDPDTEGGTNLYQVQDAIQRGYGVPMDVHTGDTFEHGWELALDVENVILWQFQYSVLHGTMWACSTTFRGPHLSVGQWASAKTTDIRWSDPLADGRRPGIPRGVQVLPKHVLREACGKLVVDPHTRRIRGLGRANFGVVRALPAPQPVTDSGDVMFNIGPASTYRDAVLKPGTVLYRDAALKVRQSAVANETPLGFLGSTSTAHVVVNAGSSNYVRREDVARIVANERGYE